MKSRKMLIYLSGLFLSISCFSGCKVTVEPEENYLPTNSVVTFTQVKKEVFNLSCALSGCHNGVDAQAGLNLSDGNAFENLVNITSTSNANFVRVQPGNSANSFIVQRLRNIEGSNGIMPPTGKLSESKIQLVENWINNGAKND